MDDSKESHTSKYRDAKLRPEALDVIFGLMDTNRYF